MFGACSLDTSENGFFLAESLWNQKNYAASVHEFEQVYLLSPKSDLGLTALYRAAMTQQLYLGQYREACQKFDIIINLNRSLESVWQSKVQLGEIYFLKLENYKKASELYESMLSDLDSKSQALTFYQAKKDEYIYRAAKSHFFLYNFDKSSELLKKILAAHQKSEYAPGKTHKPHHSLNTQESQAAEQEHEYNRKRALFELGFIYFTIAEKKLGNPQINEHFCKTREACYEKAIGLFDELKALCNMDQSLEKSPSGDVQAKSEVIPETKPEPKLETKVDDWYYQAEFFKASSYEELEKDDQAIEIFESLKTTGAFSNELLQMKLNHIQLRRTKRQK